MILRNRATIQSRVATVGAEGERTYSFTTAKANYACDIQPLSASPEQLKAWGIVDTNANAKAMYFPHDLTIASLMRVVDGSDVYEIRNINRWPIHDKAILVPIQG